MVRRRTTFVPVLFRGPPGIYKDCLQRWGGHKIVRDFSYLEVK
jgi:hypothetical protein